MKLAALAKWRGWAEALAAGGAPPDAIDLLATGALLDVASPADALEQDAVALKQAAEFATAIAHCQAKTAELLVPWAGDRRKLAAALEAADAESRRLRELLAKVDDDHNSGHWRLVDGDLRGRHRRVFVDQEQTLINLWERSE